MTVKPRVGYQGRWISVNLTTPEQICEAFTWSQSFHPDTLVQQTVYGNAWRILVIDYRFVATVKPTPPAVTGDGRLMVPGVVDPQVHITGDRLYHQHHAPNPRRGRSQVQPSPEDLPGPLRGRGADHLLLRRPGQPPVPLPPAILLKTRRQVMRRVDSACGRDAAVARRPQTGCFRSWRNGSAPGG